jgi:hypothetical protein
MQIESPVSRLPVEIWMLIFRYVCATPLSPLIDDVYNHLSSSIAPNFDLSTVVLHPFEVYHESDILFKTLRLVCRHWASVADSLSIGYLYTDNERSTYPLYYAKNLSKVETLHLLPRRSKGYCGCSSWRKCYDCRAVYHPIDPSKRSCWDLDDTSMEESLRNVKAIFLRDQLPRYERIIKAAANVRALYWDCYPHDPALFYLLNSTRLTHLELGNMVFSQFLESYVNGSLILPSVRYLSLHFARETVDNDWSSLRTTSKTPTFPHLKSLKISGNLGPESHEGIKNFLLESGRTVTELVEHRIQSRIFWNIPHVFPSSSTYFPNLRLYGIHLGELLRETYSSQEFTITPFSPKGPSFILLLYNFVQSFLAYPELATTWLIIIKGQWKVTRIMMHNSWDELESRLMNYSKEILPRMLAWFKAFFQALDTSIEFCDRNGISLDEARFHQCQVWIDFIRRVDRSVSTDSGFEIVPYPPRSPDMDYEVLSM